MGTDVATLNVNSTSLGSTLQSILQCDDIQPGSEPGYQTCKLLYVYHPLGAKMVETPIKIAQSQPRIVTIESPLEKELKEAFEREWVAIKADYNIRGLMFTARTYGVGSLIIGAIGQKTEEELNPWKLPAQNVYLSVFDPLITSGSLVLDQNPNSPTYQKHGDITAFGQKYHRSRAVVIFNEQPIYIQWTSSAFGFSGRSVYQRVLYPMKSFLQTMVTDDMVTRKAGLLVAMLKNAGTIINKIMQAAAGMKRALLQQAQTDNVLSIDIDESVQSIDMQNIDKAMITARSNVIKNIATGADMPAQILEQESFAEGFGEGTEDTKNIIRHVNDVRRSMEPAYSFMDRIVQHRAWNPDFFKGLQNQFPELLAGVTYEQFFYAAVQAFKAEWPSLLEEPESEQSKMEKVKLEGLMAVYEALAANADPDNKARLAEWVMDNANELKKLFRIGMNLDIEALRAYAEDQIARQQEMEEQAAEEPMKKAA